MEKKTVKKGPGNDTNLRDFCPSETYRDYVGLFWGPLRIGFPMPDLRSPALIIQGDSSHFQPPQGSTWRAALSGAAVLFRSRSRPDLAVLRGLPPPTAEAGFPGLRTYQPAGPFIAGPPEAWDKEP